MYKVFDTFVRLETNEEYVARFKKKSLVSIFSQIRPEGILVVPWGVADRRNESNCRFPQLLWERTYQRDSNRNTSERNMQNDCRAQLQTPASLHVLRRCKQVT
jgi:hypothetical protein